MAPGASIINLKVLNAQGEGDAADVVAAIDWAIAHRRQYRIRVLNLSLGGAALQSYRDDPVDQAVERAHRAGLVVVASAGNFGNAALERADTSPASVHAQHRLHAGLLKAGARSLSVDAAIGLIDRRDDEGPIVIGGQPTEAAHYAFCTIATCALAFLTSQSVVWSDSNVSSD